MPYRPMLPCAPDMTDAGDGRDETDETVDARSPGWCYYSTLCAQVHWSTTWPGVPAGAPDRGALNRQPCRSVWRIRVFIPNSCTSLLYMYVRLGCD